MIISAKRAIFIGKIMKNQNLKGFSIFFSHFQSMVRMTSVHQNGPPIVARGF